MEIKPELLTFAKLIDGRLFSIPEYQRCYSWTSSQRNDLFEDIRRVHEKPDHDGHFMAAVVALNQGTKTLGVDNFQEMDVVDGQQRLTTLIILYKSLQLELQEIKSPEGRVATDISEMIVKPHGGELLLLQSNHDSSRYFANYLRRGESHPSRNAEVAADRNILLAIEDCKEFTTSWLEEHGDIIPLIALIKNKLFFLLHTIGDRKTVYTVFEVLNSRGMPVSWFDRLKSILMGDAYELEGINNEELINELHSIWKNIYRVIGIRSGISAEALRFTATLSSPSRPNKPIGEAASVDLLRKQGGDAVSIRSVAERLLTVTEAYSNLVSRPRISSITGIVQARLLAVAIEVSSFSKSEKHRLLEAWEKVSFRIYGLLSKDGRSEVGNYVRLAWDVFHGKVDFTKANEELLEIGSSYDLEKAIDELDDSDCYNGWENELRYLFWRYEEHLCREQGIKVKNEHWEKIWTQSASRSIEHIWPQSNAPERLRHRLGNLTLLPPGLNSSLQAKPPVEKAKAYRDTGLNIAIEAANTIEESGWKEEQIINREKQIIEWARSEWKLPTDIDISEYLK